VCRPYEPAAEPNTNVTRRQLSEIDTKLQVTLNLQALNSLRDMADGSYLRSYPGSYTIGACQQI